MHKRVPIEDRIERGRIDLLLEAAEVEALAVVDGGVTFRDERRVGRGVAGRGDLVDLERRLPAFTVAEDAAAGLEVREGTLLTGEKQGAEVRDREPRGFALDRDA
jgi:hypothetical protein